MKHQLPCTPLHQKSADVPLPRSDQPGNPSRRRQAVRHVTGTNERRQTFTSRITRLAMDLSPTDIWTRPRRFGTRRYPTETPFATVYEVGVRPRQPHPMTGRRPNPLSRMRGIWRPV